MIPWIEWHSGEGVEKRSYSGYILKMGFFHGWHVGCEENRSNDGSKPFGLSCWVNGTIIQ